VAPRGAGALTAARYAFASAGDRVAVVDAGSGATWTYAQLAVEAARVARDLAPGARVPWTGDDTPALVAMFAACVARGATLVPVNRRLAPPERARVLAAATAPDVAAPVPLVLFTSGSTGDPKGARNGHRQLAANARATVAGWELTRDDVAYVATPLFHTAGWHAFATPLWSIGGTVVLGGAFDATSFTARLAAHRVTQVFVVPSQLILAEAAGGLDVPVPTLRRLLCGGAPTPPDLARRVRARGLPLVEGYGLTEFGPNCFALSPPAAAAAPAGTVGSPLPGVEVRVDASGGDGVGELLLRGDAVFDGYLGEPSRDAHAWYRTGDLATRDADGRIVIRGRRRDLFISGGENVFPGEVEAVLADHPDVAEVAVVAVPHGTWGEVGRAVVRRRGGVTAAALRAFARERLAAYKVPHEVVFAEALPRLGSGKVDRAALAAAPPESVVYFKDG
jgi:fatty-acyl-CoA synthase